MPGTGDTCYPEIIEQPDHHYLVYNYTSPLDTDQPWITALTVGNTLIYRQTLTFPSTATRGSTSRHAVRFRRRHHRVTRASVH